jgi:uncharacterized protein
MPWDFALILVVLATAAPILGKRRLRKLMAAEKTTKRDRLRLYASTVVSQWLAVAIVLWRARARGIPLPQLGLAVPDVALTSVVTVLLVALILTNQLLSLRQLASGAAQAQGMMVQLAARIFPQDNSERAAFTAVVFTVAICEEIIYRGFVQTAFQRSVGLASFGILASSVLFAVAHAYQGRRGMLATFVVGLCFSTTRWWTGSLLAPMITHFAADITAGMLAPMRIRASRTGAVE